jgi:hypothetical protein
LKLSSDKFFDLLNEEDDELQNGTDVSDFEKRLEEGFNKIDQKLNEALQQINQKREEPEEEPEENENIIEEEKENEEDE